MNYYEIYDLFTIMHIKTGSRVRLKGHPRNVTGRVKQVVNRGAWAANIDPEYLVEYEGTGLIPPEDWHKEEQLELLDEAKPKINVIEPKCDCGSDSIGTGEFGHSSWCSKARLRRYE